MRRTRLFLAVVAAVAAVAGCGQSDPKVSAGGRSTSEWVEQSKNVDPKISRKAVTELSHLGIADPNAIPTVIDAVRDPDPGVRREAVLGLLRLGPKARDAAAVLSEAARSDRDPTIRDYAAKALEKVQAAPASRE